jgi:hypothetical protein
VQYIYNPLSVSASVSDGHPLLGRMHDFGSSRGKLKKKRTRPPRGRQLAQGVACRGTLDGMRPYV